MNKQITMTAVEYVKLENEIKSLEGMISNYEESYEAVVDFIWESGIHNEFKSYLQDRVGASPERFISLETCMGFVEAIDARFEAIIPNKNNEEK